MKLWGWVIVGALVFGVGACACPKCAVDTMDEIGVSEVNPPTGIDRGALASVIEFLVATAGVESTQVRAIDSAIASEALVLGFFVASPWAADVRGYALMKDGRIVLDVRLVRAAPPDARYLAHPQVWPLIPFLYAAGHRLAHGGTWLDSIAAARPFATAAADAIEAGAADSPLPPGVPPGALADYLRRWSRLR